MLFYSSIHLIFQFFFFFISYTVCAGKNWEYLNMTLSFDAKIYESVESDE